jgi:capsid protein
LSYANDIDGDRITFIKKNGSTFNYLMVLTPSNATYGNSTNASIIMNLTAGDYIELFSNQRSGGNLTVYSGSQNSTFSCAYLGA